MSDNERRMIRSGLITTCLAAALGLAAALALASCGGSDAKLLPGTTADEINSNLTRVRELAAEGECVDAQDAALEVSGQVADLREIDPKLKSALEEGATRLNEVVATCDEETATTGEAEEEPTTTETEPSKEQQKEEEKQQKDEEKEQKDLEKEEEKAQKEAEKEAEKEQKEAEKEEEEVPKPEQEPPKGKGPAVSPSGGIGPGGED
jgi:septal ring factor EnvC (AmiA/AmiB activator)